MTTENLANILEQESQDVKGFFNVYDLGQNFSSGFIITLDRRRPSPKTVCVPLFQRSQARQSAAASLSVDDVGRGGIKFSAGLFEDLDEDFRVGIWFPRGRGSFIDHESSIFKSRN